MSRLDAEGRTIDTVRSERDALGRVVRVERVETPSGKQAELLARRTPARLLARYEYPADREPAGRRVPVFEPSLIAKPSVIEGKEHRWRLERNEAGQITRATETGYSPLDANGQPNEAALERSTTHTYRRINGRSLLAGIDGPLPNGPKADPSDSDVTQFEWDEDGNAITRVVQPGVLTNDLRYDAAGRVAEVRNDAGHVSRFVHDALGHITRLTQGWIDPSASGALLKARFQVRTYDAQGRLVEAGHAATNEPKDYRGDWRLAYDAAGRVHQMASARGTLWTQTFDADGRVQEASQRSAHFERIWRYRHDEQGRLTQTEDGALDVEGQPPAPSARYVHDEGRSAAFDALDRPVRLPARIEARPGERLTTAANGATTRERLDDFGRVVVLDSADSGRSLRWFDEADRLVRMRDAVDHQARYAYDVQGRIAEQAVGNPASTTRWRYEGRRLVEVQGRAQTERYEYDAFGRRTRKTVTLNVGATPVAATTAYGYDDQDRLRSQSLADGSLVVYERDGQGQVTALRRETVTTAWLRWLAPSQTLACDIRRDAGGLTHHQAGNGIRTEWQRSKAGVLAQLVHRRDEPLTQHQARTAFIDLLGMGSAHAQAQRHATGRVQTAFTQPRDPRALIDHRYLWDRVGNLLMDKSGEHATAYAYDAANRLIAAQRVANALRPVAAQASTPASLWRYHHDANGNRLLAQEGDQAQRIDLAKASNRSAETDAAGQTTKLDGKRLEWDAIGRLASVKGQDFEASYAYSHRGERIGKTVRRGKASTETGYLHDDAGRIAAELNASGRITRLVVHMADLPLAVIDGEAEVARPHEDAWQRIAQDLKRGWKARAQATVFLHLNHLSAPEAATDQAGRVVWTASYAPYGRATTKSATFKLHLRLPGQYEDEETGLHDNRHRTYDPDQGRYLSADPLGLQGGPNGFVYVAANPLRYVDPEGLVLFAFDGTGNDESDPRTYSNVVNFRELYSPANGQRFYITGPGTLDPNTGIGPNSLDPDGLIDMGRSYTGPRRIAAMEENLALAANAATDDEAVDIDIVGFSRGAAQAREFANRIVANTRNGCYSYVDRRTGQTRHQRVNFRFMGLWDTVLSTHTGSYQLRIPDAFEHVAHAVALNEHRSLFPGESIMGVQASTDRTRVERGFLGAHSDIGGSFPDGDLARVALVWMVDQATAAGVVMRSVDRTIVANPVLHDSSSRLTASDTGSGQDEDRSFTLMNGARTRQVQAQTLGMSWADTQQFISYLGNPNTRDDIAGTVDMRAYLDWLNEHGYGINMNVTEAGQ
ncbi:MAG TPA: RHS repeat-associated core domain-containing protein [Methylibium sp.]|uniref:RHS repeat-associated core domain-containing protein n=1 Tax=Methylibium sp. TaxID=2067992 RepID=UPI002DBCB593|nr:RHS repeat-associated core domain-containing protein [Methylibium sp.]HEU4458269.1 RHS repeat-associated core domain-containing protein [Methylibium sp.]